MRLLYVNSGYSPIGHKTDARGGDGDEAKERKKLNREARNGAINPRVIKGSRLEVLW
jgi:hypothetical protein